MVPGSRKKRIHARKRAQDEPATARAMLARQLANAQEAERRRISRELHDQLGQQVSALVLKLAMLRSAPAVPPKFREDIERLESIAKRLDSDLDFLVWQLRPTALDDLGLKAALTDYVDNWARHFEMPVQVDLARLEGSAPGHDVETAFYRTVQEALNNIAKHSRAKNVRITLAREASELVLAIEDDGVGFDAKKAMAAGTGLGLVGMRERASLVGGSFEIESRPGGGTTVRIRVPARSG